MQDRRKQIMTGYPFPRIPANWNEEERRFGFELKNLFDQIFGRFNLQKIYPVGIIVLSGDNKAPFSFGKWEEVNIGISGVYAFKRTV